MAVYLEPGPGNADAVFGGAMQGPEVMLSLLGFRDLADDARCPEIAPDLAISGAEGFDPYIRHTLPFLKKSGGELPFLGRGAAFLIGPEGRGWDQVVLVRHSSLARFAAFAEDAAYLAGPCHRTAALKDSRLLPMVERCLSWRGDCGRSDVQDRGTSAWRRLARDLSDPRPVRRL
jgi:uncharacterized protein (DUF1330 family)